MDFLFFVFVFWKASRRLRAVLALFASSIPRPDSVYAPSVLPIYDLGKLIAGNASVAPRCLAILQSTVYTSLVPALVH